MTLRPLHPWSVCLIVLNFCDAALTTLGTALGVLAEANPLVVKFGMPAKVIVVTIAILVINQLGYGRWLVGLCIIYGVVVAYTAVGIAAVLYG